MLGVHLALVTLHRGLQLVLSKTNRIGNNKYHFSALPISASQGKHIINEEHYWN